MTKLFTPSSEKLLAMIASAEAKFEAGRKAALEERASRAQFFNAQCARERRSHDVRRHVYVGDSL